MFRTRGGGYGEAVCERVLGFGEAGIVVVRVDVWRLLLLAFAWARVIRIKGLGLTSSRPSSLLGSLKRWFLFTLLRTSDVLEGASGLVKRSEVTPAVKLNLSKFIWPLNVVGLSTGIRSSGRSSSCLLTWLSTGS